MSSQIEMSAAAKKVRSRLVSIKRFGRVPGRIEEVKLLDRSIGW